MKKSYINPAIEIRFSEAEEMIALSLQQGKATDDNALAKSSDWDIWGADADEVE